MDDLWPLLWFHFRHSTLSKLHFFSRGSPCFFFSSLSPFPFLSCLLCLVTHKDCLSVFVGGVLRILLSSRSPFLRPFLPSLLLAFCTYSLHFVSSSLLSYALSFSLFPLFLSFSHVFRLMIDSVGGACADSMVRSRANARGLRNGAWHHIAGGFIANRTYLYYDGEELQNITCSGKPLTWTTGTCVSCDVCLWRVCSIMSEWL